MNPEMGNPSHDPERESDAEWQSLPLLPELDFGADVADVRQPRFIIEELRQLIAMVGPTQWLDRVCDQTSYERGFHRQVDLHVASPYTELNLRSFFQLDHSRPFPRPHFQAVLNGARLNDEMAEAAAGMLEDTLAEICKSDAVVAHDLGMALPKGLENVFWRLGATAWGPSFVGKGREHDVIVYKGTADWAAAQIELPTYAPDFREGVRIVPQLFTRADAAMSGLYEHLRKQLLPSFSERVLAGVQDFWRRLI